MITSALQSASRATVQQLWLAGTEFSKLIQCRDLVRRQGSVVESNLVKRALEIGNAGAPGPYVERLDIVTVQTCGGFIRGFQMAVHKKPLFTIGLRDCDVIPSTGNGPGVAHQTLATGPRFELNMINRGK